MVDSENEEACDDGLGQLQQRWNQMAPGFHQWFTSVQANVFCRHMISPIRKAARISPPEQYTTNANESANSTVKKWVQFTKSSQPAIVEKLLKLVEVQHTDSCRAIYGTGEYTLAHTVIKFNLEQRNWQTMTMKQKDNHICKMIAAVHKQTEIPVCQASQQEDESQVKGRLSIPAKDAHLTLIPDATLRGIWCKAEKLLECSQSISPAPGNTLAYMVKSESSNRPHFVQILKNGRIVCDEQCPMWRGRRLCSHTVAVAQRAHFVEVFFRMA